MNAIDCGIQRIPPEILTLFFLECIPHPTRHHPGPILSRTHPAVVVSHVCHEWRELALSTPHLWARMHIQTPRLESYGSSSLEDWLCEAVALRAAIAAWMERSAGQPLSIVFEVLGIAEWDECHLAHSNILRHMLQCAQRWREIHITIQESGSFALEYLESMGRDLSAAELPSLASFSIFRAPSVAEYGPNTWVCRNFLQSKLFAGPTLRAVTLGGHWELSNWSLARGVKHWAPLTELKIELCQLGRHITLFRSHHALQLMRRFTQLRSVSFILQHEEPSEIVWCEASVTLHNLQKLSLRGVPMVPGFARSLVLPSLTWMCLAFDACDNDGPTLTTPSGYGEGILELLRRFGGQLTTLALDPIPLTLSSFPSCLDYLNSGRLETLRIIDGELAASHPNVQGGAAARRELTHAALVYLANPAVLPSLRYLGMALRDDSSHVCEGPLAELLKGRRRMEAVAEEGLQEE